MNLSIKNKFVLPTLILIIIGMGLSSAVSYFKAKSALKTAITGQVEQSAAAAVKSLETWFVDRTLDIKNWSGQKVFATSVKDSFIAQAARKSANEMLTDFKSEYKYYANICLSDLSGKIVAAADMDAAGKLVVSEWESFKKGLTGELGVSQVMKDPQTGSPLFVIAMPVTEKEAVVGVMIGIFDLNIYSQQFIDPIKVGKKGYAYMFNRTGMTIAHPERSNVLKLDFGKEDFGKEMLAKKDGVIEYALEGVDKIVAFHHYPRLGWTIGVAADSSEILEPVKSLGRTNAMISVVVVVVVVLIIFVIGGYISRLINQVVEGLKDAAQGEGDLTKRLDVRSKDEVGSLANWFNTFVKKLQGIISDIAGYSGKLSTSSSALLNIAEKMSEGAERMSVKSNSVAAAAEQMSSNMTSVAAAIEQSSTNINMVSSAAEEMTSTITEISQNTERTRSTSNETVSRTKKAADNIDMLNKSAQEIGRVIETINDISEQTNLLALNATIEAARAGEAGKGFAVVAGEIKDLARQTAEATLEIKEKIVNIQNSTNQTVSEIQEISGAITSVNEMVDTVAAAVEEQSATTKEIAENVTQAARGIQEVTENVTQSSHVANEIASDIAEVNESVKEISENGSRVNVSAAELNQLAGQLKSAVDQFKF